jgi:hypothetical protein
MSIKLHLQALLRLRNSIQRRERNLKLLRANRANGNHRHHPQPLRHLEASSLCFHSPVVFVGTSFRDANALNLALCSRKADLSAERTGFTSSFSAVVARDNSSQILSSSRRPRNIPDIFSIYRLSSQWSIPRIHTELIP